MPTLAPDYPRMDPEHRPPSRFLNTRRLRPDEQITNREPEPKEPPEPLPPAA